MFILELILLLAVTFTLAFIRCKPLIWTATLGIILIATTATQLFAWPVLVIAWVLFLPAALFANLHLLRRQFITKNLIHAFRQVLPPMSDTEREALEAGKVWWEGELFQGRPDWETLHTYPKAELNAEEQAFIDKQVTAVCDMLNDWEITLQADLPQAVWDYLKQQRFFGMLIPKEYGGLGFSAVMQSTVVMKIATRNISAAVTTMVPNSLGPAELLLHYGTEEQKNYYLPRLADGREVPCFALTSTEGGSDAGAMPDRGVVCKGMHEGKEVLGIKLNFSKRYITLAPVATVVGLAFKLVDPDHLLGNKTDIGITCALLPATHAGVEIGRRHYPVYTSFMNGPVVGKDVFIPLDWIIGGPSMAGQGWRMLMECLSAGRGISLPALGTAVAKVGYFTTGAYAKLREQFKVSIGKFEGVQEEMAKMAGFTYLLEACRLFTAGAVDLVGKPALASAIAKYHMTEMARKVNDIAMDIHAGRAIQTGPRNYLATLYLHAPVAITVEGANILTRNLMIFGQGAVRCHPYVFDEIQALSNPDQKAGLQQFDKLFVSHIGYGISNFARALGFGLTKACFASTPKNDQTANYYKQMTRMSTGLALAADIAMLTLGGDLKRRENLSARLGDVLSYLYLASAALKYYEDYAKTKEGLAHVHWTVQYCLYQMQEAFYGVFANFPGMAGHVLKWVIFPLGRSYHLPKDKLSHQLAEICMQPGEFRNQVTKEIYFKNNSQDSIGRVECALQKMLEIESILKTVHDAMRKNKIPRHGSTAERVQALEKANILTAEELTALKEFEAMRLDAMEVDSFAPEFFKENAVATRHKKAVADLV